MSPMRWLEDTLQDLRHALQLLRRDRSASTLIVLVLALGIGANTAIFTLLKAAFLDPLPYRDASRLVTIVENTGWIISDSEFLEIRARSRTLSDFVFTEYGEMQLSGSGEPVGVYTARATSSFFPTLGVAASLGRTFTSEEDRPGHALAVVLSDAFWRSRMGADPRVIGRTLRIDQQPATIVGVLPAQFHFDDPSLQIEQPVDVYLSRPLTPVPFAPSASGHANPVRAIGRLRDGVTLAGAQAEITSIAADLARGHPLVPTPGGRRATLDFQLIPLRAAITGNDRPILQMLAAGAGLLLLIGCANTAQLLLARAFRRSREVAIRAALGARRWRLIRQFLTEGLVLAGLGGAAGWLLSIWMVRALIAELAGRGSLLRSAHPDWRVAAFTLAVSMCSGILFASMPAIRSSRLNAAPASHSKHAMIAVEAALSIFLLCGAALIGENLWTLISAPMGFDPDHVVVMKVKLPWAKHENMIDRRAGAAFEQYLEKIEAIPGVDAAATVTSPPLRVERIGNGELIGENEPDGRPKIVWSDNHLVSADYFRTLRIPLLAGRAFRADEAAGRVTVAVVNQEFARRFGYSADIVGKRIPEGPGEPPTRIVGMVANVRTHGLAADPYPEAYLSSRQLDWGNVWLMVRSSLPPADLMKLVRGAIESANSEQAVYGVTTMRDFISSSFEAPRFDAWMAAVFASLAIAMAALGLYSVIACLVSQRTAEIAIRVALGATRADIARTVAGATMAWMSGGMMAGLALSAAARGVVRTLSNASIEGSPWIYALAAILFFLIAMAAAYSPMRRASRLDPAVCLRCE